MNSIHYRWMTADETHRLAEIDRSEEIRIGYTFERGQLRKHEVEWDTPSFYPEGEGDHTISQVIGFCLDHSGGWEAHRCVPS